MLNKSLYLFVSLFLLSGRKFASAQDTLIFANGSEVYGKVVEIGDRSISYKKQDNPDGPTYTIDISRLFMIVYKGGKRETFMVPEKKDNAEKQPDSTSTITSGNITLRLVAVNTIPDKKNKAIKVSANVAVLANDKLFVNLSVVAYQEKGLKSDFSDPKAGYLASSNITFMPDSKEVQNTLYEKYESESGKGYGWALPPGFFLLEKNTCVVAFLEQKNANKEILGFGGIRSTRMSLVDCSTLEKKLLSASLLWVETNFGKVARTP